MWNEVHAALAENRVERVIRSTATAPSLLAGLVYDDSGERMSPTHANKKGTRYRFYVSPSLIKRGRPRASEAACRVPAADLETLVEERLCALLRDEGAMLEVTGATTVAMRKSLIADAADLARRWPARPTSEKRAILHALVERVEIRPEAVDLSIRLSMLPDVVRPELDIRRLPTRHDGSTSILSVPARLRRTGMETKLLIQGALGAAPERSGHEQQWQADPGPRRRGRGEPLLLHPRLQAELPRAGDHQGDRSRASAGRIHRDQADARRAVRAALA